MRVEPSAIAVGAIVAATRGLRSSQWRDVLSTLSTAVNGNLTFLEDVVRKIETTIERESSMLPNSKAESEMSQGDAIFATPPSTPTNKHQPQPMDLFDGNETPTDVTDIMF